MEILLIAGLWLDGSAWDDVVRQLEAARAPSRATHPAGPG